MTEHEYDTMEPSLLQVEAANQQEWEQEVESRLAEGWQEQARQLGAFERQRKLRCVGDLLRGLLAYVLCYGSFRMLGYWSVCLGLADLSEAAWRKRLRQAEDWLDWLFRAQIGVGVGAAPAKLYGHWKRVLLLDATNLSCQGARAVKWRLHTAFDLLAGQLTQVRITTHRVAEDVVHFVIQEGDLIIADSGYGYVQRLLAILQRGADLVIRFSPATLRLFQAEGGPQLDVVKWLKGQQAPSGHLVEREVWLHDAQQWVRLRVVGLRLTAEQTERAIRRKRRKAQMDKRQLQPETLYLAGWLLVVTSLEATPWRAADVLQLYRARWHVELFFKRLKQVLHVHAVRCVHPQSARASLLAILLAWVLQEQEGQTSRAILQQTQALVSTPLGTSMATVDQEDEQAEGPVSEWRLVLMQTDLLRCQVRGHLTAERLRACLPRLHRFLCSSPRKRRHWGSWVHAWFVRLQTVSTGLALPSGGSSVA